MTKKKMDNERKGTYCPDCGVWNRPERRHCFDCEAALCKHRTWIRSFVSHPLFGVVLGAVLLISVQLAATWMTIYTSNESGDFSVSIDPASYYGIYKDSINNTLFIDNKYDLFDSMLSTLRISKNKSVTVGVTITIDDLHSILKPYPFPVSINISKTPKGIETGRSFQPLRGKPPFTTSIYITITNEINVGDYPITIQAQGEDGKIRTGICDIQISEYKTYVSEQRQMAHLMLQIMQMFAEQQNSSKLTGNGMQSSFS